ncbi:MAG: rhomboid family intramembrane serine protease [Anaerolineales bacterium]|nr:rhomboid family intramembrane serine protease [Anaerolineales bacterium]
MTIENLPGDENGFPTPPTPPPGSYVPVQFKGSKPVVTYVLMGFTILVFLLQIASQFFFGGADFPAAIGLKANEAILQGQLWRLITPILLHGSILHIAFNMYALQAFGPGLEFHYGRWRFLLLYLLAGFAGNVTSFLFTIEPSLGSSTAIFGLLGAESVFLYQNRELFGKSAQRALINIAVIAGANLVIGLSPGIDNWGHVGGLLGGGLFALWAGPRLEVQGVYPELKLVDNRESGSIMGAALGVGLLFSLLVLVKFLMQ